ncbi:hypothetical protein ACFFGT_02595 [Mucilaginibacter angelicae]|uniref:Response regulatory domain-containing protein n=1 Tax=Mucilaginibacter angelicae TaxID=869718 RepID=A0ABV6L028_9SPHI
MVFLFYFSEPGREVPFDRSVPSTSGHVKLPVTRKPSDGILPANQRKVPQPAGNCPSYNNNIRQEYHKYGFDGYIEKPFDLDLLYRILRKHIPKPKANLT